MIIHDKTQLRFFFRILPAASAGSRPDFLLLEVGGSVMLIEPQQLERMQRIRLPMKHAIRTGSTSGRKRPEAKLPLLLAALFTSAAPDYSTFNWICIQF